MYNVKFWLRVRQYNMKVDEKLDQEINVGAIDALKVIEATQVEMNP